MNSKYLVINCGSSSLKFSLYEMPSENLLVNGYIEKIGFDDSFWTIKLGNNKIIEGAKFLKDHGEAVNVMVDELINNKVIKSMDEIKCVGHRVLHGGEFYSDSVIIDNDVLENIVDLTSLGPLHHPGQIAGIKAMKEYMPDTLQIAVFDTAFHQTMPKENYIYAVPYEWYLDYKIRRYGFHGTSHKYITSVMKEKLGREDVNLIICHVGSGASISCIKEGNCFDTSMGFTPLDGLIMGTRSGEIDPSIIEFMVNKDEIKVSDVNEILNKKSGLLGICGKNDFRDVVALKLSGDDKALLAYNMFKDSIIKHIAEYYFKLKGNVDAVIFTAGVLENNIMLREDIINDVSKVMDVYLDKDMNDNIGYGYEYKSGIITNNLSKIPFYVIPTNEELMIVRDCYRIINEFVK